MVVPVYRPIYEPLRAYLMLAAVLRILEGTAVQWDKLERSKTVRAATERRGAVDGAARGSEMV
jgi:biofilm PGA synthesis N-glycosyltransferase PgaC